MNTLLGRFSSFSGDDTANGRTYLWKHAIDMFNEKPICGYGYGSFNTYASNRGVYLTKDGTWNAQAHSIYYQLCGEMGIIGTLLFFIVLIIAIVSIYKIYKRRNNLQDIDLSYLFLASSFIIVIILYGLTGNVIYYTNQIMFYFLGLSLCIYLRKKYKNGKG